MDLTGKEIDSKQNPKIQLKINQIQLTDGLLKSQTKKIARQRRTDKTKMLVVKKIKNTGLTGRLIIHKNLP
jgi:hypothetical protein